jgi:hypothetical protein
MPREKRDYVRDIAQAYANQDPELEPRGRRVLEAIEQARLDLAAQATAIRHLLNVAPKAAPRLVQAPPGSAPDFARNGPGLSDELKRRVRAVWLEEMRRSGRDLNGPEVVELLRSEGVTFDVEKPHAAVGTVLYGARERYKASGQTAIPGSEDLPG